MNAYIKALSFYLPQDILTNEDLIRDFPEWNVNKVAQKVGVNLRHLAHNDETAGDMAENAAINLFTEYSIEKESIDFILLCTQSPDYRLPSTACILQHKLGIPTSVGAFDYNLGCSGCIYGLAIAKGLISAGIARNILLLTSETYNKYIHPDDKSNRSIFGDGAAACLVSTEGFAQIGDFILGTDGSGADNLILKTGGARFPKKTDNKHVDAEGHVSREDYLYMNGGAIFNFTLETVPNLIGQICERNNLKIEDIDYFVFHQANKYMLDSIRTLCSLPKDKFYNDISSTGNTVSSTIFIALKECINKGILNNCNKIMTCGFGVGLSWGGCILSLKY